MARPSKKKGKATKVRAKPVAGRKAKTKAAKADVLDAFIDSAAVALKIPVAAEWKPAVKANLAVILRFADNIGAFKLPDGAEPAPVFRA